MPLSRIDEALIVATFFRGGDPDCEIWVSNSDQVVTLSLFYSGDFTFNECAERFSVTSYVKGLYQEIPDVDDSPCLSPIIEQRYRELIVLIQEHPELIEGAGNLVTPADPAYTSCRLTHEGQRCAVSLIPSLPLKPHFPNWPDKRSFP